MRPIGYGAFLLRRWSLRDGLERVEVRHIQSGASARFGALGEALAWIGLQGAEEAAVPPADGAANPGDDEPGAAVGVVVAE